MALSSTSTGAADADSGSDDDAAAAAADAVLYSEKAVSVKERAVAAWSMFTADEKLAEEDTDDIKDVLVSACEELESMGNATV